MKASVKLWNKVRQPEGFISVDPLPSVEELRAFYGEQYYQQSLSVSYQAAYSDQELAYKRMQARLVMHAIGGCRNRGQEFLDVGCGEGFLLAEASHQGWSVTGVDLSGHAIGKFHPDLCDNVEIDDAMTAIDHFAAEGRRFDACVLQNVLEHVAQPREMLGRLRGILAPGGKLLVTLPNDYSRVQEELLRTGMVDHEYWLAPPQHLHYFNIPAACTLARARGYTVADIFSDFPIEVFLFHPGSNYVSLRETGPLAHRARMTISLLCAEQGLDAYLALCRACAGCGIGRAFTLVLMADENH